MCQIKMREMYEDACQIERQPRPNQSIWSRVPAWAWFLVIIFMLAVFGRVTGN